MSTCSGRHAQAMHMLLDPPQSFGHKQKAASLPDRPAAAAELERLCLTQHQGIALPAAAAAQC